MGCHKVLLQRFTATLSNELEPGFRQVKHLRIDRLVVVFCLPERIAGYIAARSIEFTTLSARHVLPSYTI